MGTHWYLCPQIVKYSDYFPSNRKLKQPAQSSTDFLSESLSFTHAVLDSTSSMQASFPPV